MPSTTQVDMDLLEALDEFLEQGIKSGAFAELGGTGWNRTAEHEAATRREHLGDFLVRPGRCQAGHRRA